MKRFVWVWLTGLVLLAGLETTMAQPRRVLLLHSFGPHFPPWNVVGTRFSQEFRDQSPHPIDLYEASLQSDRFSASEGQGPFIHYLNALFAERGLDLVVALGAPAARFFVKYRVQIFPSTPLLIAGTDERAFSATDLTRNDTAVPTSFDQVQQIEHILQVLPHTTDIAVAIGYSPLERFWVKLLQRSLEKFQGRVNFRWFNKLSAAEMVQATRELPAHSAIYYATVRVDAKGVPQEEDRMFWRIREVAAAPYTDGHFGQGIVGGPLVSLPETARRAVAVAVRIINGEAPSDIKTPAVGMSAPVYDWRELQRWKISEAALPAGSTVVFREPSAWEQYRFQILATIAALVFQAMLISWLLYERRYRQRAETTARDAVAELAQMNRIAAAGELSASIAHELNQPLTGIVTRASAARRWLAAEKLDIDKVRAALDQIENAGHRASDIMQNVRAVFKKDTHDKIPVDVNSIVLEVLALGQKEFEKNQIEVRTDLDDRLPSVTGNRVQLQQVILNLVMNAVEAMQSAPPPRGLRVQSRLSKPGVVQVSVEDTGTGVDPTHLDRIFKPLFTTKASGMGIGLSICRTIIENHQGRIWVSRGAERGSIFQFELPTNVDS